MSYAAIIVALLVAFILFKIVKGMIKIFLLMLLLLGVMYYFNGENLPFTAQEKSSSIW